MTVISKLRLAASKQQPPDSNFAVNGQNCLCPRLLCIDIKINHI